MGKLAKENETETVVGGMSWAFTGVTLDQFQQSGPASGVCLAFRRAVPFSRSSGGLSSASWPPHVTLATSLQQKIRAYVPFDVEPQRQSLANGREKKNNNNLQWLCKRERF